MEAGSERQAASRGYEWIGRIAVYLGAVVGGWFLARRVVEPQTEHHPFLVGALIAAVVLAAAAVFYGEKLRADRQLRRWTVEQGAYDYPTSQSKREELRPRRPWLPPLVIVLALVVWLGWTVGSSERGGLITYYCEYGAVSRSQLAGCIDHVSSDHIRSLTTNAARWAEGTLDSCESDAGPFCDPSKYHNDVEVE
jgi:MFS family permease